MYESKTRQPLARRIFVRRLAITQTATNVTLNWIGSPTIRLQRSATLSPSPAAWQNVNHPAGASTYSEASAGTAFYRLRQD